MLRTLIFESSNLSATTKMLNVIKNSLKMVIWVAVLPYFLTIFGILWGTLFYSLLVILWSIVATLVRVGYLGGLDEFKKVLNIMFSTDFALPFTAYGCYCSPKYGEDGRTKGFTPIDGLDKACQQHDRDMLFANIMKPKISLKEYVSLKNQGDLRFMKSTILSDNNASGIYLLGLEIGFTFRIVSRTLFKH